MNVALLHLRVAIPQKGSSNKLPMANRDSQVHLSGYILLDLAHKRGATCATHTGYLFFLTKFSLTASSQPNNKHIIKQF